MTDRLSIEELEMIADLPRPIEIGDKLYVVYVVHDQAHVSFMVLGDKDEAFDYRKELQDEGKAARMVVTKLYKRDKQRTTSTDS